MSNSFPLTNRIRIVNPASNLDLRYGPWPTLNDALTGFNSALRQLGLTVAVSADNTVREYWYRDGIADSNLILKNSNSLSSNNAMVIAVSSTEPALRITQEGLGNALIVEDSTNPDSSPFVIDAAGTLVVGATAGPPSTIGLTPQAMFISNSSLLRRLIEIRNHGSSSAAYPEIRFVKFPSNNPNVFDTIITPLCAGTPVGAISMIASTSSTAVGPGRNAFQIVSRTKYGTHSGIVSGGYTTFATHRASNNTTEIVMTLNEDKVGIGPNLTNPNATLTVAGDLSAKMLYTDGFSIKNTVSAEGPFIIGTGAQPVTGNIFVAKGGNLRVEGVDLSMFPLSALSAEGTDGQSLFDLRSAGPSANYNLSIASSGVGHFIKFFGGRDGDAKPFILVKTGEPLRFASFSNYYNTGNDFTEYMRIDTATGNVGIGAQNPQARLVVQGTISATQFLGQGTGESAAGAYLPLSGGNVVGPVSLSGVVVGNNLRTSFNLATAIGDYSFAENVALAIGNYSHAEGTQTVAVGDKSHVEGSVNTTGQKISYQTYTAFNKTFTFTPSTSAQFNYVSPGMRLWGNSSYDGIFNFIVLGRNSITGAISATTNATTEGYAGVLYKGHSSDNAHAEGNQTTASGSASHAEGFITTASGVYSHAEGYGTIASGSASHAEGHATTSTGIYSHSEGSETIASGGNSHSQGKLTQASGENSHSEGYQTIAMGTQSHAQGYQTKASGNNSHAEGQYSTAYGLASHAEGLSATAFGNNSHAEGNYTIASGANSHAEGDSTTASGGSSHAEGSQTTASGGSSHAEGSQTTASGNYSHAEGQYSTASGNYSHAEGRFSGASGEHSHAEGQGTIASGNTSHAEGLYSFANGDVSHASGVRTATGNYSYVWSDGQLGTNTAQTSSTRTGQYMVSASGGVFVPGKVGIGTDSLDNALTVNGTISGNNLNVSFNQGFSSGNYSFAEGSGNATGNYSHAEGQNTTASGNITHAEGYLSNAVGTYSHTEGYGGTSVGDTSHSEGRATLAIGSTSHTEGVLTTTGESILAAYNASTRVFSIASSLSSKFSYVAPGTTVYGGATLGQFGPINFSFQIASRDTTNGSLSATIPVIPQGIPILDCYLVTDENGYASHAEGSRTTASGDYSHAENFRTTASGLGSHAEGLSSIASGNYSHAEGQSTRASGTASHAQGINTTASGSHSHAQGTLTVARGQNSHAGGINVEAAHDGTWIWKGATISGMLSTTRANQFMVSAEGGSYFGGTVGIGTDSQENPLTVVGVASASQLASRLDVQAPGINAPKLQLLINQNVNLFNTTNGVDYIIPWNFTNYSTDESTLSGSTVNRNILIQRTGIYRVELRYSSYDLLNGNNFMRIQLRSSTGGLITTGTGGNLIHTLDQGFVGTTTNGEAMKHGVVTVQIPTAPTWLVATMLHSGATGGVFANQGYPVFTNSAGTQPYIIVERIASA